MTLQISANDFGQVRVFATDNALPSDVVAKTPQALAELFGAQLNPDFVDIVKISDLGEMSLSSYIAEGYDMTPDLADKAAVDSITGTAVIILSRATGGVDATLTLGGGLRHVTTYSPIAKLTPPEHLPDASAKGILDQTPSKPPKSNARIGGMVAMYALIAMFALVALVIWVGG